MNLDPSDDLDEESPGLCRSRGRRRRYRGQPAPQESLDDFIGQPRVREQLQLVLHRREDARRHPRPRPAVRPARAGQDQHGDDHRRRTGLLAAADVGPGAGTRRRPGRDAQQPRRGRRAVHRRDPPHRPAGRGDALPRDGGLPGRRRRRQGSGRHVDSAGGRTVHPGRGHHAVRCAHRPAARPVRVHRPHGLLRTRGAAADPHAFGAASSACNSARTPAPRSRAGRAARRASRTACCAVSATTPRSGPTASSPATSPSAALAVYDVDQLGLDRLDRSVLSALVRSFGGGPVGVSTLAVAVGEEPADRRGGVRAVPGPRRHGRPDTARPCRHRGRLDASGPDPAAGPAIGGIEVRVNEPQASPVRSARPLIDPRRNARLVPSEPVSGPVMAHWCIAWVQPGPVLRTVRHTSRLTFRWICSSRS